MSITLGPIFNSQNGKVREWSIMIELFDKKNKDVPIRGEVSKQKIQEGYYATFWTRSGYSGMKMTDSARTVVSVGKNIGKKNETNVLTQAWNQCQSKYTAKINSGYTATREENNSTGAATPFPMAVKSWKDHKSKLEYPLFVQPKLDGIRMIASYTNGEVSVLTRRLREISGFIAVKEELKRMFESSGMLNFTIDGELYAHGMNLQHISGIVRNESTSENNKEKLKYFVFDCFDVSQPLIGFDTRIVELKKFVQSSKSNMVVLNDTFEAESNENAEGYYKQFVGDGYEGMIYKSTNRPYEFDFNKEKRSSWYLKRKKQDDKEFPIVGFTQGKGKDLGCIVFELRTQEGKTFNCVPNGTYEYRKELYTAAVESFDTSFRDKLAKVVFDDLSKDGVPLRGRIVQIDRDLSFD